MWVDCSTGRLGTLRSVQLFLGLIKETGCESVVWAFFKTIEDISRLLRVVIKMRLMSRSGV